MIFIIFVTKNSTFAEIFSKKSNMSFQRESKYK